MLFFTDSSDSECNNHFNPWDKWDMEMLQKGFRGFSKKSIIYFGEKAKDKKFMKKLQKFYDDQ